MTQLRRTAAAQDNSARSCPEPRLEARDLSVAFGGVRALDDVTLTLQPSLCYGIIGPNGAGKTTLLDVLSGLRKPTTGEVLLDGAKVTSKSPTWLARAGIRRTFQRHQTFGWLTVEENLMVPLEWRHRNTRMLTQMLPVKAAHRRARAVQEQVRATIEECGLSDVATVPAATLPIGKLRLVELARAIAERPKILLLDEPTSGMGSQEAAAVGRLIANLKQELDATIVIVEHNIEFILNTCEHVVVLDQGRVLSSGTAAQVRANPAVLAAYIGTTSL